MKKKIKTNFDHYAKQLCIAILQNPDIGPLNVVRCFALDHGAETRGMKTATKQFVLDWLYAPYGKVTRKPKKSLFKTLSEFDKSGKAITDYLNVGDVVEEKLFNWVTKNLEVVTTEVVEIDGTEYPEPFMQFIDESTILDTYITFEKNSEDKWEYCGRCEKGSTIEEVSAGEVFD